MTMSVIDSPGSHICVNCNSLCAADDLYCFRCGYILPHAIGDSETHLLGKTSTHEVDLQWGTGYFHHRARLFLRLSGGPHADTTIPVLFQTPSVIVGRTVGNEVVNIDLTPFGAQNLGVSRRHICIERIHDSLQIQDLDSSNGTFLNRTRLVPRTPHVLRNRAVLELGKLVLRVQFA